MLLLLCEYAVRYVGKPQLFTNPRSINKDISKSSNKCGNSKMCAAVAITMHKAIITSAIMITATTAITKKQQ